MDIHLPKTKTLNKESSKHNIVNEKSLKNNKIIKSGNISEGDAEEMNDNQITKMIKNENKCKKMKTKKLFPCHVCGKQMISASKLR